MLSAVSPQAVRLRAAGYLEWREQVAAWLASLAGCRRKPTRKRVHALRSATLRLRSQLEFWHDIAAPAEATKRAVRRWSRQASRLRRALGPVREADVFLAKLERLRREDEQLAAPEKRLSPVCLRQISVLQRRLERRREDAARKLVATLNARHERLNGLGEAIADVPIPCAASAARRIERIFAQICASIERAAEEFAPLDAGNLHAFRCSMRRVHFVSAQLAPGDLRARHITDILQKMQAAAGEWHDWQQLLQKALRVFPRKSGSGTLAAVLQARVEDSLRRALGLCRRSLAQLLSACHSGTRRGMRRDAHRTS